MRSLIEERKSARDAQYLGPKCFGRAIREKILPPTLSNVTKMVEKYSDTANPETWLSDYVSSCNIYEGSTDSAVHFLPLMLTGMECIWIEGLLKKTVHTCSDMKPVFIQHF